MASGIILWIPFLFITFFAIIIRVFFSAFDVYENTQVKFHV